MFDNMAVWVIVGLFFAMAELFTPGLFYSLCVTGGAFAAALSAYYEYSVVSQYIIFLTGLIVSFLFLMYLVRISTRKSVVRTNVDALSGKLGCVTVTCGELLVGQVLVAGQEWTAFAVEGQLISGTLIRVVRVQGVRLIVEKSTL